MSLSNHGSCAPQPVTHTLDRPFLDSEPLPDPVSQICHVRPRALPVRPPPTILATQPRTVLFEALLTTVCRAFGVTKADLLRRHRAKTHTLARHSAVWIAWLRFGYSHPELGRMFGRDQSSIGDAIHRVVRGIDERNELGLSALAVLAQFDTATGTRATETSSSESSARTQASEVTT